eukprot:484624_1
MTDKSLQIPLYPLKDEDTLQNEALTKMNRDDKIALRIAYIRWFIFIVFSATIISYFTEQYFNKTANKTVHTDIEKNTPNITTPYFYFSCLNASKQEITGIHIQPANNNAFPLQFSVFAASNFTYKQYQNSINWSVVYLDNSIIPSTGIALNVLVIPPSNSTGYGHLIIKGIALRIDTFVQKNTSDPLRDFYSGIFWAVDSVQDGIKDPLKQNKNIKEAFEDRFGTGRMLFRHEYSTFAAITESMLNVIVDTNKWYKNSPEIKEKYYQANVNSVAYHENFTHKINGTDIYTNHSNYFYFYINPTGVQVRTIITTERADGIMDTLSSIGGIISPVYTITLMLLNLAVFGFAFVFDAPYWNNMCCLKRIGYARNKRLTELQRHQIKQYLQELKLLPVDSKKPESGH